MIALVLDAATTIGAHPVEVRLRDTAAGPVMAGPLLFIPSASLLAAGMFAASPVVIGGHVWVAATGTALHLGAGACIGHAVEMAAPPPSFKLPETGGAGAPPPEGLKPAPPTTPASAPPASASQAQGKAKGKPAAAAPDPTA